MSVDLQRFILENRRGLSWLVVAAAIIWLFVAAKEVMTLLLFSYALAILIDPLVLRLQRRRFSRSTSVLIIGAALFGCVTLFLLIAIPVLIQEYNHLVSVLPQYLISLSERLNRLLSDWFGITLPMNLDELWSSLKEYAAAISGDQLRNLARTAGATLLSGYSITLTILNLTLLPFFVFYIARDLHGLHRFIGRYIPDSIEGDIVAICREILRHVYAFAQGQITVSLVMAVLYAVGLALVGLPSGIVIGAVAGVLNFVPYLGIAIGLTLATVVALVTGFSLGELLLVWSVFVGVQMVEGMVLTPRIVGESVGIHPLAVMVALIIGGKLFGLPGLVIAVPAAAAIKVLVIHLLSEQLLPDEELAKLHGAQGLAEDPGSVG